MGDFKDFLQENEKTLNEEKVLSEIKDFLTKPISEGTIQKAKKYRPMKRKYERSKNNPYKKKNVKVITANREFDFMKFYGIVKRWASVQYSLTIDEIEMLMYFYSEPLFTKKEFDIYNTAMLHKNKQIQRFIDIGMIEGLPGNTTIKVAGNRLYRLTMKANRRVSSIYKKLTLQEEISEYSSSNKFFRLYETSYKDKRISKLMIEYNKRRNEIINGGSGIYLEDEIEREGD
jgi:hypothetical protein